MYKDKNNHKFLKGISKTFLIKNWKNRFEDICKIFIGLEDYNKIDKLLVSEPANPFHKIIMYASYMKGTVPVCFNHGNDFGILTLKWGHQHLISHSINYCFENKQIKNFEETKKLRSLENITKTNYLSADSNFFELLRKNIKIIK